MNKFRVMLVDDHEVSRGGVFVDLDDQTRTASVADNTFLDCLSL